MIKFICSDLDGTLLTPDKSLPEEIFPVVEKLHERGIIFTPASGRQLPNLKALFAPVIDKIAIIAENGSIGWYGGKIIYTNPTPKNRVRYALDLVREVEGLHPLLSCADCAYYESEFPTFVSRATAAYNSIKKAYLNEIAESETVMKISVWDEYAPCSEHGGKILQPVVKGLRTVLSGFDWFDISCLTANKGNALKAMLEILGIRREESMAFGDHMNDLEMLEECGHPYVTANAFPALKAQFGNTVPSNADKGVIVKLNKLLAEI